MDVTNSTVVARLIFRSYGGVPSLRTFANDKSAGVAIMFAMISIPALALLGCSIDYARSRAVQNRLQAGLDAAVLSARNEPAESQITIATAYFEANTQGIADEGPSVSFIRENDGNLGGTATANVRTIFAGIMNLQSIPVRAAASASRDTSHSVTTTTEETRTVTVPGVTPCIHVMSQSDSPSWKLISNSNLIASNCVARVRSNRSIALKSESSSNVKFKAIFVKGGASIQSGAITILDAPNKIITDARDEVTGDPFDAHLTRIRSLIDSDECTPSKSGKTFKGGTVDPGTYCGATVFDGVQFSPGIYVIASGNGKQSNGTLSFKGKIDGRQGVTFYLADNKSKLISYAASEGSTLHAPISGPTQGLLIIENSNRGNAYGLTIASVNKQSWKGVVYLPSVNMTLRSLSEWPTMNISLSVNTLVMDSLSSIFVPYAWMPFGEGGAVSIGGSTTTTTSPTETTATTTTPGYLRN